MSLTHTFGLLAHPDQEWEAIRNESESVTKLYAGHILLLALIPAVAGFIGTTQVGWQIGDECATAIVAFLWGHACRHLCAGQVH